MAYQNKTFTTKNAFEGSGSFTTLSASTSATISVNSTGVGLTVSQTGTGKALVTNGDVIFANGTQTQFTASSGVITKVQLVGTDSSTAGMGFYRFSNNTLSNGIYFGKSRSATVGGFTAVTAGDGLGSFLFEGANGSAYVRAGIISVQAEETFSTTSAPGRINFSVTPTGSTSSELAMSIRQNKLVELSGGLSIVGSINADTTTNSQSFTTTGAGTITITSGTTGNINNMNIGAATPGSGAFTTISSTNNVTIGGDLTVNGGNIVLNGTGRIQGIDSVISDTDAVSKIYVDSLLGSAAFPVGDYGNLLGTAFDAFGQNTGFEGFSYFDMLNTPFNKFLSLDLGTL